MKHTGKPKFVHVFKDRHGQLRIYFRRHGRQEPLPGPLHSPAFYEAYNKALGEKKVRCDGTMESLITRYYQSAKFKKLAASSKAVYQRILEKLRVEHGHRLVADLDVQVVNALIEAKADHPAAANNFRDRLSGLMQYAIKIGLRSDNPVRFSERVEHQSDGFRTWSEDDITAFRAHWPVGSPQRLAMELLAFTGLRRSDVVRLGPQHLKDGWFTVQVQKTKKRLEIPAHPTLLKHLDYAPEGLVYIQTERRAPRSAHRFGAWFTEAAQKAGLPEGSSAHGLRKAAARRLAEAGCSGPMIQSITGHASLKEVDRYILAVHKKGLAQGAMATIVDTFPENTSGTKSGKPLANFSSNCL